MSQTEVQLIKNGAVVDADINGMSSSKLSGALPAISGASLTNLPTPTGKTRNLSINGAMLVAQRGTSSTSQGYYTVDRILFGYSGHDEALTQSQGDVAAGTTPYTLGFRKTFKVTNGNQTSGAGSSDYVYIDYSFEAQDIANSGWNYTSASSFVTFSFWVKSSVAQSFKGYFITSDGSTYSYAFDTGSLSANTWTKVTKTIPGNSNLTVNSDNGKGLGWAIWPFIGTDLTNNSTSENAWVAHSSSARTKDATSTWWTTNDATFEITGVQLEVGSVATDFEHRSFGEELALCQRYYQQSYQTGTSAGTNTATNAINWYPDATTNYSSVSFGLPCVMRTQPTVTIYSRTGASGKIRNTDAGTDHPSYVNTNNNSFLMFAVNNSSISVTSSVSCHYTASAEL